MQETSRKSLLNRQSTIKIVQAAHTDTQDTNATGDNIRPDWRNQSTVQASSERDEEESAT